MNQKKIAFLLDSIFHTAQAVFFIFFSDFVFQLLLKEEGQSKIITADLYVQQLMKTLTILMGIIHLFVAGLLCQTDSEHMAKTATFCELGTAAYVYYSTANVFVNKLNLAYYAFFCLLAGCLMLYTSLSESIKKKEKPTKGQSGSTEKHEIKIE
eukprot:gene1128-10642_t